MAESGAGSHVLYPPLSWHSLGAPNLMVAERACFWGKGFEDISKPTHSHKAPSSVVFPSSLVPPARFSADPERGRCSERVALWPTGSPRFILHGDFTCWDPATPNLAGCLLPTFLPCSPAGPWPPAGMGKGRVSELHPRNLLRHGFKTLVATQAEEKGGGHLGALSWCNQWLSHREGPFHGDPVQ